MKKYLVLVSIVALSACGGGFDDLDAAREAGSGIGSTVTKPDQPSIPEVQTRWQYSSTSSGATTLSVIAYNTALNSFTDPTTNTKYNPRVELEKRLINNESSESVAIFVGSMLPCLPSCDVRIRFDGQLTIYRMQNSGEGMIKPLDRNIEKALFRKFTTSKKAVVSYPLLGLGNTFDAQFDLQGYDPKRMMLQVITDR